MEKDETLVERRQIVLDNIRDNDEAGAHYREVCTQHFQFPISTFQMTMSESGR